MMNRPRLRATAAERPQSAQVPTRSVSGPLVGDLLRRLAYVGTVVASLCLVAAPAAVVDAAAPTRIVLPADAPPLHLPAGQGCSFDVTVLRDDPNAKVSVTLFDDGRVLFQANATPTLVNDATGASVDFHSTFTSVETFDPVTNTVVADGHGVFIVYLSPGDEGPHGTVGEDGAILGVSGRVVLRTGPSGAVVSFDFSGNGKFVDLCDALDA